MRQGLERGPGRRGHIEARLLQQARQALRRQCPGAIDDQVLGGGTLPQIGAHSQRRAVSGRAGRGGGIGVRRHHDELPDRAFGKQRHGLEGFTDEEHRAGRSQRTGQGPKQGVCRGGQR